MRSSPRSPRPALRRDRLIGRVLLLAAALLVLGLLRVAGAGAAAEPPRTTPEGHPVPELDWRPCEGGFECATAVVPQDYARPNGATVELAVVRRRALDPEHRIGSVFLNPGGPGGSATGFVREAPPAAFQLLSRFDVIGFDPRGVGGSRPAIDCDELDEPPAAMTPDTFDRSELIRRSHAISRLCLNRPRGFLASLTTANAARDLDVLRAAVGDARLTYVGISWGGMLGATYASLFPGRTRALVLDSPIGGDVWLNRPFDAAEDQLVGFERSLHRFFTACAAAGPAGCPFAGPDAEDRFDALLARLGAAPLDLGDGRTLDGDDLAAATAEALYSKFAWSRLAAGLAAAEAGDGPGARDLAGFISGKRYEALYDAFASYLSVERRYPHAGGLAPYVDAADRLFAVAPHFAAGAYETASERFWPVRPRGAFYGPYRHAPGAPPALVLHTTHDPATPYSWGKRVVRDLGNARLVTYRGDGHGVITDLNPCALGHLVAYLDELAVPPAGAQCVQDAPFPALAARSRPTARWRVR
jgi:pimeloyl-ACP methyl ester carboxylesterase